jgi:hypothetical protein
VDGGAGKTPAAASNVPRTVPGPEAVAGAILARDALARSDLDPKVKARIVKDLGSVLPGQITRPGAAAGDRAITQDDLAALIPGAAVTAAGLDPAKTPMPPAPVLWQDGANQLLVQLAGVHAVLGDGFVELSVPVRCDETGDATVTVTFVTGTPDRPAGGVATTEDRPRGPAVIVENWHDALIAFCWHTLVIATSALSGTVGSDLAGNSLITVGLAATSKGIAVTPMGRHTFTTGQLP